MTLKAPVDSYVGDVGVYSLMQLSVVDAIIIFDLLGGIKKLKNYSKFQSKIFVHFTTVSSSSVIVFTTRYSLSLEP